MFLDNQFSQPHEYDLEQEVVLSRIGGTLYGQALGDAFGMPSELMRRDAVQEKFGYIDQLIDGPDFNPYACHFVAGEFTDDTQQALAIAQAFLKTGGHPTPEAIKDEILAWVEENDAWNKNLLGPSSHVALLALKNGATIDSLSNQGVTNGAAMRISPAGCVIPIMHSQDVPLSTQAADDFIDEIYAISSVTHKSDIAIAGAVAIASFISSTISSKPAEESLELSLELTERAQQRFSSTFCPSLASRILWAIGVVQSSASPEEATELIYSLVGAGVDMIQAVPAAFALAFLGRWDPMEVACLAANLGGDTDTIGAMATAMAGATSGIGSIPNDIREKIDLVNNVDLFSLAKQLHVLRKKRLSPSE